MTEKQTEDAALDSLLYLIATVIAERIVESTSGSGKFVENLD